MENYSGMQVVNMVLSNMAFLKTLTRCSKIKDPSQDVHSSIQLNSFGTYATPSLGERAGMDIHLRKYTIAPNNSYYRLWQSLLIILVICSAWMAPFEFAFIRYLPRMFFIVDTVVDLIFLIDIVVTFFIPYMDKRKFILVDSISDIAIRYISTWFIFDIASSIPYQLFALVITKRVGRGFAYNLLSMFRLWRLRRVSNLFSRLEKDIRVNYFRIRCLKLMGFTLLSVHIMGCIWYLLAERYHNPKRTWIGVHLQNFKQESIGKRYVYALFWSMITIASLGYGNLTAVNPVERLYTMLCMFYKSGLAAYLIGNMADLAVDITRRTQKFRISVEAVSRFAIQNHLPSSLRDQMMNYMSLKFKTESLQQEEIMSMLPKAMRTSICQHLFFPTLKKAYLFHGTSNDFILQLIAEMRAEYFQPGEDIILHHEAPTEFYIIVSGKVELLIYKDAEEQHHGLASEGDVIGEIGALCCMPQPVIARSKSISEVLCINRSCFLNVIRGNTADGQIVIYNLFEHLEGFKSLSLLFPKKIESLMSNFGINAPSNLCMATLKGNFALVERLLKSGRDPNEVDSSGRTSLHIASANGLLDCVVILLHYGADPNIEDENGNVPLWEAVRDRHKYIAETLWESGAHLTSRNEGEFMCKAAELGSIGILEDLLKYGCDINSKSIDGATALHIAVAAENVEITRFLIEQGARIDMYDTKASTPFVLDI